MARSYKGRSMAIQSDADVSSKREMLDHPPWSEVMKEFASTGNMVPRITLSNFRLYGSLAYCRIDKQVQSECEGEAY
ncbi:unnamed protein product [Penicillium manginii]